MVIDMDDNYTQDEDESQDDEETDGTIENNWRDPYEGWTSLGDFGQGGTMGNVHDWRGDTTAALQTPPGLTQIFHPVNPNSEIQQYYDPPHHSHYY
ncbi:hypothetical protein AMTRI_Chr02g262160 [Amborella trichopoda]